MNEYTETVDSLTSQIAPGYTPKPRFLDGIARRALFNRLSEIHDGELVFIDSGQKYYFGQQTERCPLSVEVNVLDPRFYSDVAFGGSIGGGEAYMYG